MPTPAGDCTADPVKRFTARVEAYVKARPRYPRAVIDHLAEQIGLEPSWHVVDVGSGTGISCELFLEHGHHVTGVEPNDAMRAAAERSLQRYANFHSISAAAEATTLRDACADLVVAAQAFHWFDRHAARREFTRILRPGGLVLLMWNDRQLTGSSFLEAYEQLLLTFGTDYLKVRHNNIAAETIAAFFAPCPYQHASLPNEQQLEFNSLRDRLLSSSYVPLPSEPQHDAMLARLREIFNRHQHRGCVTLTYRTEMFYGRLR